MNSLNDVSMYVGLYQRLLQIVERGNDLEMEGEHSKAIEEYKSAWSTLPEPVEVWEEAHWIAGCMIESYLSMKEPGLAKAWCGVLLRTMPSNIDVGSVVTVGRVYFDLGELDEANKYFKDAYDFGGKRSFQGYESKYLEFYMAGAKI